MKISHQNNPSPQAEVYSRRGAFYIDDYTSKIQIRKGAMKNGLFQKGKFKNACYRMPDHRSGTD